MFWLCCAIYSVKYSWVCAERGSSDGIQMEMKSKNLWLIGEGHKPTFKES